jgi:hypothetical protein
VSGGILGVNASALEALADSKLGAVGGVDQLMAPGGSVLVASLTESAVPEVSADLLCLFRCDTVLTRGLGEGVDPMVDSTLAAVASSHVCACP